jgi:hypothetical protein
VEPTCHLLRLLSLSFLVCSVRWSVPLLQSCLRSLPLRWSTTTLSVNGGEGINSAVGNGRWGCGARVELLAATGAATMELRRHGSRQLSVVWSSSCSPRGWGAHGGWWCKELGRAAASGGQHSHESGSSGDTARVSRRWCLSSSYAARDGPRRGGPRRDGFPCASPLCILLLPLILCLGCTDERCCLSPSEAQALLGR